MKHINIRLTSKTFHFFPVIVFVFHFLPHNIFFYLLPICVEALCVCVSAFLCVCVVVVLVKQKTRHQQAKVTARRTKKKIELTESNVNLVRVRLQCRFYAGYVYLLFSLVASSSLLNLFLYCHIALDNKKTMTADYRQLNTIFISFCLNWPLRRLLPV